MKLIATLVMASLAVIMTKSDDHAIYLDDCSAQLSVEKNRSSKSADEEGAQFLLELTNTSRDSKTFTLTSKHLIEPCNNKTQYNRGSSSTNVKLEVSFQNNKNRSNTNLSLNNGITLNSGESYKFAVNVTVPKGTPFKTWSCIEVEVKATDCKSTLDSKILSVYVADPSEG